LPVQYPHAASDEGGDLTVDPAIPEKTYFRIGEVSKILGVETYVVRYWETEFKTVRPVRTRSDQRLYRRRDVEELLLIQRLLYKERFTIDGAKKQLVRLRGDASQDSTATDRERLGKIKEGLLELRNIIN
jgi:DNA-binding transcriptional MerR regulator